MYFLIQRACFCNGLSDIKMPSLLFCKWRYLKLFILGSMGK
uniref:Uncharacterized protein n=1 Tax=Anguilla anguilla TaxID=7936 RepID=A0A0E9T7U6_ANGAN